MANRILRPLVAAFQALPPVRTRDERLARTRLELESLTLNARATQRQLEVAEHALREHVKGSELLAESLAREKTEHRATKLAQNALAHEVEALRAHISALRDETESEDARPSFRRMLLTERLIADLAHRDAAIAPRTRVANKLASKQLARVQGVRVAEVISEWPDLDAVDFAGMPAEFVFKNAGGASSRGVFPLRRSGDHFTMISGETRLSISDIRAQLRCEIARDRDRPSYDWVRAPFFAETLIKGTEDSPLPIDVKFYTFFGEIGHILLRSVGRHLDRHSVRYRFIDASGRDLGNVSTRRAIDPSIPLPPHLGELVDAAQRISLATNLPFVRVDLYDTDQGAVFGELTPCPGEPQRYTPEHDALLGSMWQNAQLRLDKALADRAVKAE